MSRCGMEADRAVVLGTTFYLMSHFVAEDAQQGEVLDCYSGNSREFRTVFEGMVLEVTD